LAWGLVTKVLHSGRLVVDSVVGTKHLKVMDKSWYFGP
jgi:hypothetical protein